MRLFHTHNSSNTSSGSALEHYIGNMSEALVRARAERDIRRARAAAEAAIRVRSSFLENMNHELRTPLNGIIGFASMLNDEEGVINLTDEQKSNYVEYILQSADLLLGHINTILEVAAFDNGSVEPEYEQVDVHQTVGDAIKRAEVQAKASSVAILTADQKNPPLSESELVWGDTIRLGQALDHLLKTSIKSCQQSDKENSRIFVRVAHRREGWAEIQIRDDGTGFTRDDLDKALNAFGDTPLGLEQSFTGPGVGIAIAKTFVEMQGGEFSIKSLPGKGALSTLSFPMSVENMGTVNESSSTEPNQDYNQKSETIAKSA